MRPAVFVRALDSAVARVLLTGAGEDKPSPVLIYYPSLSTVVFLSFLLRGLVPVPGARHFCNTLQLEHAECVSVSVSVTMRKLTSRMHKLKIKRVGRLSSSISCPVHRVVQHSGASIR